MGKRPDGKLFEALEAFAAASDERSLSKAARILGRSTPTVASMITRLESDIGVRLLRRTARGVSLTPEGEALLPKARSVVRLASEFERDAVSAAVKPFGRCRSGQWKPLFQFLPDSCGTLIRRFPVSGSGSRSTTPRIWWRRFSPVKSQSLSGGSRNFPYEVFHFSC